MTKGRVCVLLMDSLGIGASADAAHYGDKGANTLGHIHAASIAGAADKVGVRQGSLHLPHLTALGLYHALYQSSGLSFESLDKITPHGYYGYAVEQSLGKDTPSGHWELAGVPVKEAFGYFPYETPCFSPQLINNFLEKTQLHGVLGQVHASGTDIIEALGTEHLKTGYPIIYTSADSVFQIAAHEQLFGLEKLYDICKIARELLNPYRIGRVIARPFTGSPGSFKRTGNRCDFSMPPPEPTLLEKLKEAHREVIAIGKTADIFAHKGITKLLKADGNMALFDSTLTALDKAGDGSLIFTNFVDFDSAYGHRRDVSGYAAALEAFDKRLPTLLSSLRTDDRVLITADHGCDPTFPGTDHTREHVPILWFGKEKATHAIGKRDTFSDMGQSIAAYLGIKPLIHGQSFLV